VSDARFSFLDHSVAKDRSHQGVPEVTVQVMCWS